MCYILYIFSDSINQFKNKKIEILFFLSIDFNLNQIFIFKKSLKASAKMTDCPIIKESSNKKGYSGPKSIYGDILLEHQAITIYKTDVRDTPYSDGPMPIEMQTPKIPLYTDGPIDYEERRRKYAEYEKARIYEEQKQLAIKRKEEREKERAEYKSRWGFFSGI